MASPTITGGAYKQEIFEWAAQANNQASVRYGAGTLNAKRLGLAKQFPPATEVLRGSLVERYVTCGNPACKCARGERHGPVWYLTVTLRAAL